MDRHRTFWFLVLVGWLMIGLSFTFNYYFFAEHYVAIFKQPPTLSKMLVWELPYWLLWAGLAPLIFWFAQRFPIDRERWLLNSLFHIAACVFLSIAHRAIYLIIGWVLHVAAYQELTSIPQLYSSDILFNLPTGFMSYGTIFLINHEYRAGDARSENSESDSSANSRERNQTRDCLANSSRTHRD